MKFKHLIVGTGMTAFSMLTLAATDAATPPAGSAAINSAPAATPKAAAKPATKAKSSKKAEQGKTRGLKSKKGKECSDEGTRDCTVPLPDPPK